MGELNRLRLVRRAFFDRPVLDVAPELLGAVVVHGDVAIRLTEVEAYDGADDPASHAFRGKTARNAVMFGRPGHAYVYFTYGMHFCVNLVCGEEGRAAAVLLRAGEVVAGAEVARMRRADAPDRDLARGPARLTKALAIDRALDGADVCDPRSPLRVLRDEPVSPARRTTGPRVGVDAAADRPWRWWIDGDPTVSAYRPHTPRRRPANKS
ncbi:MAG: DNA-3-methyladenine glycosylase [Frankiaceae bacterium]|jgi:DNA-3-methyladenine glycosylase|nr:DNA-3-methyladenine glycosylase [Frankiaceae bacterium]